MTARKADKWFGGLSGRESYNPIYDPIPTGGQAKQRDNFDVKIIRRNNPIFGPRTKTVEYIPKGKAKMFARMEEDINDDGLPIETRLYDESGKQTVKVKVNKQHKINGVSVVDEMESTGETPAGQVVTETDASNVEVDNE